MTIEQYYQNEKPAPDVCRPDASKAKTEGCPVIGEYITIPTLLYSGLVGDRELLGCVVRILTDKRLPDYHKLDSLNVILDLPYEEGGDPE